MQTYKSIKIKKYFKKYSLLLITNGVNQNSRNRLVTKQKLSNLKLHTYKIHNQLTKKILKKSIYENYIKLVQNVLYLFTIKQKKFNFLQIRNIEALNFLIMSLKLNEKIYPITQIQTIKSSKYKNIFSILYQFLSINLKFSQILFFSKQCDLNA